MSRLVLFGVGDDHVDALTHLRSRAGEAEMLVVHPDPEALVLKLARMAEIPTASEPPEPRSGDVLVEGGTGNGGEEMSRRWREAGAFVQSLAWLAAGTRPEASGLEPSPADGADTEPAPESQSGTELPPTEDPEPVSGTPEPEEEEMPLEMDVPAQAWSSPEGTFAYLVHASGGPDAAAVLWWDGGRDSWVPWTWVGPEPEESLPPPERRTEFHSVWGRFALEAEGEWVHELPRPALVRVAEDAAVRDLLVWERERERVVRAARDLAGSDRTLAVAALETLLSGMGAAQAFVWQRRDSGWALLAARGEGVRLEGTLILPDALLTHAFTPSQLGWKEWRPSHELRLVWRPEPGDRRWPLRLARLESALAAGDA